MIDCWDGETSSTAKRIGVSNAQVIRWAQSRWFIEALKERVAFERERAYVERIAQRIDKIAQRMDIQQFWSEVMANAEEKTADRLKASELLAKSQGEFITKVEVQGNEEKPVQVVHKVELEQRIKQLRGEAAAPAVNYEPTTQAVAALAAGEGWE